MRDRRASKFKHTPRQPRTTKGRPRAPPPSRQGLPERSRSFLAFHEFRARARERGRQRERETESDRTRRLDFKTSFRFTGSTLAARRRRVSLTSFSSLPLHCLFTVGPLGFWNISVWKRFFRRAPSRRKTENLQEDLGHVDGGGAEMFREGERYKGKSTRKSRPRFAGFFCHWADLNRSGHSEESERRGGVESST